MTLRTGSICIAEGHMDSPELRILLVDTLVVSHIVCSLIFDQSLDNDQSSLCLCVFFKGRFIFS